MRAISSLRILALVALFVAGLLAIFVAANTVNIWIFIPCVIVGFLSFPLAGLLYSRWIRTDPWIREYHRWVSHGLEG